MHTFLIILFLLIPSLTFAQKKQCDFSIDSILKKEDLPQLADELQSTHLKTLNKKRFIPKFIKRTLNCWTKKFDIANPGKQYQAGDAYAPRLIALPTRQLTYLGLSNHYLIITYKKGGFGTSDHILIFKFDNKKITKFWAGGNFRLSSQDEVIHILKNYKDYLQSNNSL